MSNDGIRRVLGNQGGIRWIVLELLVLVAASSVLGSLLIRAVITGSWSLQAWIVLAALVAGLAVPFGAAISVLRRRPIFITLADRVTLGRGVLAGGCATLAIFVWAGLFPPQSWLLLLLAAPAALLDAVDGWVARRTRNANAHGARLDMETDAAFLMILSIPAAFIVGPWVLLLGAMRYLFAAAAWWRPALKGKLEFSHFRRIVAASQSVALVIIIAPITPLPVASILAGLALALLIVSFGKDVYTLERAYKFKMSERGRPVYQAATIRQKIWKWFCLVLAVAVAVEFVNEAIQKLLGTPQALAPFSEFGWPIWFAYVVAVVEIVAALLLVISRTRIIGALLLAGVMVGATLTNLVNGHPDYIWVNALLLAAISLLAWQQSSRAKVPSIHRHGPRSSA